jgi:hypothetical protein
VPIFKALTNSALPLPVRAVGEVLEGAAKPVGSDAEGVVQLEDQKSAEAKVIKLAPKDHASQSTGNNALRCILMDVLESQRDAMGKKRRGTVAA